MYSSWSGSKSAQYEDSSDALIDCGTDTTLPDQPDQEQGERGQEGAEGGHDGDQGTHNDSQQEVEADILTALLAGLIHINDAAFNNTQHKNYLVCFLLYTRLKCIICN